MPGKLLRFIAIFLMGLTMAFNLLGGIGTTCVALAADIVESYPSMAGLLGFQWLYQLFVVVTVVVSLLGIRALIRLIRGKEGSFNGAIIWLGMGLLVTGIHMFASQALRGQSAPANMRFYLNLLTMLVFLLFLIPGLKVAANFEREDKTISGTAGGMAAIAMGILTLTAPLWGASTHTLNGGINYADAFHVPMTIAGWSLVVVGAGMLGKVLRTLKLRSTRKVWLDNGIILEPIRS